MPPIFDTEKANVLVIRPDRIGDVVLSTPVFTSIRKARPGWKIYALVKPLIAELLQGHPDIDEIIELTTNDKPAFGNTSKLADTIRSKKIDIAIHLYSDFWVSLAVWRAGVPLRIGTASKLARIFYNHTVVQHRSSGGEHETDYNLGLLSSVGINPVRKSSLAISKSDLGEAASLIDTSKKNIGVFPGSGGSARNWSPKKYAELVDAISQNSVNLILMGGPDQEELVAEVKSISSNKPASLIAKNLKELAAFTEKLDCLVAPSTGPLHIASAVGTPAVGIYCPIRVCLPSRWGPIGERDTTFVPEVPVCEKCIQNECEYFDCMDRIPVERVADAVREKL